jgi:hypothetical protein
MTTNLRYFQLMQQTEKNPLRPSVARAFDLADDFKKDVESIYARDVNGNELRRDLSPEGKRGEAQKHLRRALRDLRDLQKPLDEYRAKPATMRAAAKRPAYDKTDLAGVMNRREYRDRSVLMTSGQRAGKMTGPTRSLAFLDAVLEFEDDPWMSGIDIFNPNELQIYEAAKQERLRDFHGPLIDQADERDATESEVRDLIVAVARGDIQNASGLEGREFEEVAKKIESRQGAVWLTSDRKQVVEIGTAGATYRPASADEARDGRVFTSEAYAADRVA